MKISDIVFEGYLNCEYKGYLKLIKKTGEISLYEAFDKKTVCEYKESFLSHLSSEFKFMNYSDRKTITSKDLAIGFDYLLDVKIEDECSSINLDGLKKIEKQSSLGDFSYVPVSIFPYNKIFKNDRLLLAFKSLSLSSLQGNEPDFGLILCSENFKSRRVSLNNLKSDSKEIVKRLLKISEQNMPSDIFLNRHCEICEFKIFCPNKALF